MVPGRMFQIDIRQKKMIDCAQKKCIARKIEQNNMH